MIGKTDIDLFGVYKVLKNKYYKRERRTNYSHEFI